MTGMKSSGTEKPSLDRSGKKRIVTVLLYFSIEGIGLLLAAGSSNWTEAWIYLGLRFLALLTLGVWVARKNLEVVNERGRSSDKTKSWDKVFAAIYAPLMFITPAVAGLDAVRFGWSTMANSWQIVGFLGLIPAMIMPYWAMSINAYMVTTVRIQEERGQQVVVTGPYRYLRHPMYVGAILLSLCGPMLLGSWWALLPGGISVIAFLARTYLEDETLQVESPGYKEFTQRTRYRLLPGVW